MSNEAGRILLAILHGKPVPNTTQRRHRTPFSGLRESFGPSTRGALGNSRPPSQQQPPRLPPMQQQHKPLPYFRVPNSPPHSSQFNRQLPNEPNRVQSSNNGRPVRRYTREAMLAFAESESARRLPKRLELAFEMYPAIRRKRFGELVNPYYYDPASTYALGPTQLWDSQLQQWVVMGHK